MRKPQYFSPAQCRAARGLLAFTVGYLAFKARIPVEKLEQYESGFGGLGPHDAAALARALGEAGVIARPATDHGGEGVRLKWPAR